MPVIALKYIKNKVSRFLATFFYRIGQSKIAAKLKIHGRIIACGYDICATIAAWSLACFFLIGMTKSLDFIGFHWKMIVSDLTWIIPLQLVLFRLFGLYRGFWRFASIQDLRKIAEVSALGALLVWAVLSPKVGGNIPGLILKHSVFTTLPNNNQSIPHIVALPSSLVALLYAVFLISLLSWARLLVRLAKDYKNLYGIPHRIIIIGAGDAGESLVRDLLRDRSEAYKAVAFVDDDLRKQGREIRGVRVRGTIAQLPQLIAKYDINLILIAIPSASSASMRTIVNVCEQARVRYYTLPSLKDLANGRVSVNVLRNISLEDLLGRYPVTCQWDLISSHLQNKTIFITGGGGSIGSELCRQIAALGIIKHLVIVDSHEFNLYAIDLELRQRFPSIKITPVLVNITDRKEVQKLFRDYTPHLVFHAAAYKHVPLLECQPRIAIYNNIIGTMIMAEEAVQAKVETFILISTDKAVNPTNIMGATKRAAEYFCQNLHDQAQSTRFITVRFGNVLNSAGSVVPLFKKQIEAGGPVTVTHPEITRFFMTIPEASQLILQAAFLGEGGEIFVLDMGDPIKIRYLAEQMIKLAGKKVDQDIKIVYTGLRPGEKLYEECFYPEETLQATLHEKILRAQSQRRNFAEIRHICLQLAELCHAARSDEDILVLLKKLVPEYQVEVAKEVTEL